MFILAIRGEDEIAIRNARYVALWTTMITFLLSLVIWIEFDPTTSVFQFEEKREWLGDSISYRLGVDGISMLFVILTTFLMPLCILASWNANMNNAPSRGRKMIAERMGQPVVMRQLLRRT